MYTYTCGLECLLQGGHCRTGTTPHLQKLWQLLRHDACSQGHIYVCHRVQDGGTCSYGFPARAPGPRPSQRKSAAPTAELERRRIPMREYVASKHDHDPASFSFNVKVGPGICVFDRYVEHADPVDYM